MALTLNHNGYRMQLDARDAGAVGHVFPLIRDEESWTEVEIEIGGEDEKSASALPLMATASDVREIVKFLRKKPSGVTLVEAVEAMKKPTLDPRKMTAYEYWGLVTRSGDRIRLSPRGQAFARRLEPETEAFRELLRDTDLYRAALVWLRQEQSELITDSALAAYWQRHHREAIGAGNEKTVKANVACFFQLCQAAEFGTLTIGKRGQPTRLRVDQDELESYLSSGASALPSAFSSTGRVDSTPVLLLIIGYVFAFAVTGCYVAARLAPRRPMLHALILGVLGLLFNIIGTAAKWQTAPAWYHIVSLLLVLPAAWLGGKLGEAQLQRANAA